MGMTPELFFESFVEGNSKDCHDMPGNVRRAFNAAVAVSHLADHYFTFNKRHNPNLVAAFSNIGSFVEHLSDKTGGAFRDIRSISNAYKHLYTNIDPKKAAYSSVSSTLAIQSIELPGDDGLISISEECSGSTEAEEGRCQVVFTRKDGTTSEFLPILKTCVDYWSTVFCGGA